MCVLYLFQQYSQTNVARCLLFNWCVLYLFQQYSQTVRKLQKKQNSVCCICFSNTLKQINFVHFAHSRVCCICFSNTLKHHRILEKALNVCVVFVLAILSNTLLEIYIASACVLYLFQQYSQTVELITLACFLCVLYLFQQYSQTPDCGRKIELSVCCICFSNTLKQALKIEQHEEVCVVFVLAILSNFNPFNSFLDWCVLYLFQQYSQTDLAVPVFLGVCVLYLFQQYSQTAGLITLACFLCVLYLFQQYSQTYIFDCFTLVMCVLYLFQQYSQTCTQICT